MFQLCFNLNRIHDVMFNKRVGVFYVMFNKRVGVFYHNIKHDA